MHSFRHYAPLFVEQHCLAEQPTRQGRVDVVHCCLHFQASSGPPSGRTMGLCLACVGMHATDNAGMQAAVQIVESNQHGDLSAMLHCSTRSLWKSLLFFHSKSGKFEEMESTLAGSSDGGLPSGANSLPISRRQHPGGPEVPADVREAG